MRNRMMGFISIGKETMAQKQWSNKAKQILIEPTLGSINVYLGISMQGATVFVRVV